MFRKNLYKSIRSSSGQALVENVLIVTTIAMIVFAIGWFARILITKQQLIMAARYGTDLISYSELNENEIREEIRDYLCGEEGGGRKLDPAKLSDDKIKIKISRENDNVFDSFPFGIVKYFGFESLKDITSYVEIYYEYRLPVVFAAVGNKLYVSGRSEVIAGTGCKYHNFIKGGE